jgi:predicted nucleic acid-binding protein
VPNARLPSNRLKRSSSRCRSIRAAAPSYGLVVAAVAAAGRSHRRRVADLLIASVAVANGLSLYTRNPADYEGLETLLTVTPV